MNETNITDDKKINQKTPIKQLKCQACKLTRELTGDEIQEWITWKLTNQEPEEDAILQYFNLKDKKTCPHGDRHEYEWNMDFFKTMLADAKKIKYNNTRIIENNNIDLEIDDKIQRLIQDTETKIQELLSEKDKKIKEMEDQKAQNIEMNKSMENYNDETKDTIIKLSGRDWSKWL